MWMKFRDFSAVWENSETSWREKQEEEQCLAWRRVEKERCHLLQAICYSVGRVLPQEQDLSPTEPNLGWLIKMTKKWKLKIPLVVPCCVAPHNKTCAWMCLVRTAGSEERACAEALVSVFVYVWVMLARAFKQLQPEQSESHLQTSVRGH